MIAAPKATATLTGIAGSRFYSFIFLFHREKEFYLRNILRVVKANIEIYEYA
jgi:hypothetical protein